MLECRHEKEINSNHRSFDKEDKIMEYRYPHLCSPITLGNTTFKSRIFSAPMGGTDITADCWELRNFHKWSGWLKGCFDS